MSIFHASRSPWTARMLSILRFMTAFTFFWYGTQKMFNYPPTPQAQPYVLLSQRGLAAILELFGGTLLMLGLFTRPVAFLLAGEMAVAYFQVHIKRAFLPLANNGVNAVLFCFIFLYLMVAGGGPWSIDHVIASRRGETDR